MTFNPWDVSSAAGFLKYCCPECDYQVSDLPFFEQHASRNHELSEIFFRNIFENTKVAVKEEPILPEHVECKTVLEETDPFEDNSNYHTEEYEPPINQYDDDMKENLEFFEGNDGFTVKAEQESQAENIQYLCKTCGFVAPSKSRLTGHLQIHAEPKSCPICPFKSHYRSKLKIHIRKKHGEEEVQKAFPPKITQGEYSCHVCPFKSNFRSNLRKHIRRKHGADELKLRKDLDLRWFSVGICNYKPGYKSSALIG